jgi:hypothetical protein
LTIDLDATLLTSHSDKEGAEATWKRGYGFHPMLAYADQTGEALPGELRPGNAGAGTAVDQVAVAEGADPGRAHREHRDPLARRLRGRLPRAVGLVSRSEDPLLGRL